MSRIHPTAVVDSSAELADDVEIGPCAVIEADVRIGRGTRIEACAKIGRYTTLGEGNVVDHHAVIGGLPQDLSFKPSTPTFVKIGNNNVFREGVTISRATVEGQATLVGNDNYWMANAHAGHDVTVGDNVILTNNAMLGGHARIDNGVVFGGGAAVHQFCWVGERAMFQGLGANSMHVPPYCIHASVNKIVGLNHVGLRRAKHITPQDRREIKLAFMLLYRRGLTPTQALAEMDTCSDWGKPAQRFREFVRKALAAEGHYHRGICPMVDRGRHNRKTSPRAELEDIRARLGV
jgi:UDP-N-acetylglucosamine acyltransferase